MLVLGDSLSAGSGIALEDGWVHLLSERLRERDPAFRVVNASVSGDTTHGALTRLPATLRAHRPEIVIVELGGNDGLRGVRLDVMRKNLDGILALTIRSNAQPVLVGVRMPPNLGAAYNKRFRAVYSELADAHGVPLVASFLKGIGGVPSLMQDDGVHPSAAAQPRMLQNVWPALAPVLERDGAVVAPP